MEDADPTVDILPPSGPARIALPLIKTILDTIKTSLPPTAKCNERCYFVPSKGYEHLYSHPPPDSLVVDAANQCERQSYQGPSPKNREVKRLDLFGERSILWAGCSSTFQISSYWIIHVGQWQNLQSCCCKIPMMSSRPWLRRVSSFPELSCRLCWTELMRP